jgi:hypothetical protein
MCRPKLPDDRVRFDEYEMWVFRGVPKCGSTELSSQKTLWQNSQALVADRRAVPQSEASSHGGSARQRAEFSHRFPLRQRVCEPKSRGGDTANEVVRAVRSSAFDVSISSSSAHATMPRHIMLVGASTQACRLTRLRTGSSAIVGRNAKTWRHFSSNCGLGPTLRTVLSCAKSLSLLGFSYLSSSWPW